MDERQIKEKILRDYEIKKSAALLKKAQEKEKAYKISKRLKEIDEKINELGLFSMRNILKDKAKKEEIIKSFNKEIKILNKEREKIIKENKINPSYDKEQFFCPLCKDTGFLENSEYCECFKNQLKKEKYEKSNFGKMLTDADFDAFDLSYYDKGYDIAKEALDEAKNFVKNFDNLSYNLFFYGKCGLGKTFLSSIIAKELLEQGKTVSYARATKMFSLYDDYKFRDYSKKEEIDNLYNCDLLVIDDLGSEFLSKTSISFLFDLINERLINNKKIIINTNLEIKDFSENYTVRLTSRIYENFKIYGFLGEDIRIQKLKKGN